MPSRPRHSPYRERRFSAPIAPRGSSRPPPLGEFRAEVVGDVQMRHRTDPQGRLMQLPIKLQELAGISGAGIGDDKADVEIVSGGGDRPMKILPRDIKHDDSMLHTVTLAKFTAHFLKQVLPPRNEDNIDSGSCDLPRKFLAYSGRGTRDECPGAESFFIECDASISLLRSTC